VTQSFKATLKVKVTGEFEKPEAAEQFLTEMFEGAEGIEVLGVSAKIAKAKKGGTAEKIAKIEIEIKELSGYLNTIKIASIKTAFTKLLDRKNATLKKLQDKRDGKVAPKKTRKPKTPKS
jgi:hypothetical protein